MTGAGPILRLSERASDDARFCELLLGFSAAASPGLSSRELLQLFCRRGRAYFGATAAYLWQFLPPDQLEGWEADGGMAEQFRGMRLKTAETAFLVEAIQSRKARYVNSLDVSRYPLAAKFEARSALIAPLVVVGNVIGAAVWTHSADPDYFREDHVEKAAILAGQLGALVETARLREQTREEERRSEVLLDLARSMRGAAEASRLLSLVAEKLRLLLQSPLVCVFAGAGGGFQLAAAEAWDPALSASILARREGKGLDFAADISRRAVAAGELITVSVNPASHRLGDVVPAGTLLAAPFSTSSEEGAVLVYPRREATFTGEEKTLAGAVATFAALALSSAGLFKTASSAAHEVNNLLTAIAGFAGLLVENPEVPESTRKNLRVILEEAESTQQSVQNLLRFARPKPVERRPIEVNPVLKRALELGSYDRDNRGVSVIANFGRRLPWVLGDAHRLQQVFWNLLNNACHAVGAQVEAPRIEITTGSRDGAVEVTFRDNRSATGRPDPVFESSYPEPSYPAPPAGDEAGLGLSICYGIVKELGGEILCQNNAPGPGRTFVVRLPVEGAQPEAARQAGSGK